MRTLIAYLLLWPGLALLAIANGFVREAGYGRYLSELHAHQVSSLTLAAILGLAVWLFSLWRAPQSSAQALVIGIIWLAMALSFEFLFGHYVAGHSWSSLLQDYDLSSGRVWPLLLAWTSLLPYFAWLLSGARRGCAVEP
jgi:phosphate/sulfate permease